MFFERFSGLAGLATVVIDVSTTRDYLSHQKHTKPVAQLGLMFVFRSLLVVS
jgi:hypothetical protein